MPKATTWDLERELYALAQRNLGLFLTKDWIDAGLTIDQLKARRKKGFIIGVLPKVMALADATRTFEFQVRAGTLRGGPIAAGFGATAAAAHGLLPAERIIHIASTRNVKNRHPDYRSHRSTQWK